MPLLTDADTVRLGTQIVDAVYLGATRVWPTESFAPSDIVGLTGWYDASQLTLADGALVNPWPDLSGNGRPLISQPAAIAGTPPVCKTNVLNGLRVVRYTTNGDNHLIGTTNGLYAHFFVVCKFATATFPDYNGLISSLDTYMVMGTAGTTQWYPFNGALGTSTYHRNGVLDPTRTGPMNEWAYLSYSFTVPWTFQLSLGLDRVYPPRYWHGDIAEVIGYNRVLTDAERIQVEAYLQEKWWAPPPFSPTDTVGLVTWLDASQLGLADGAAVTAWPNLGSGDDPTIVTGATPLTMKTGTLNSKPVVRFTANGSRLRSPFAGSIGVHDWTVIYIVRLWGANAGRAFSAQYPPSNLLVGMHTSQWDTMYDNGTWLGTPLSWPGPGPLPWRLYEGDSQGGVGSRFFINGVQQGGLASGTGGLTNGWALSGYDAVGAPETMDIEVAEFLLYDRKLTDAERVQLEGYLRDKWGLA